MEEKTLIPYISESRTNTNDNEELDSSSDFKSSDNSSNDWPVSIKHFLGILNAEKANEAHMFQGTRVGEKSFTFNDCCNGVKLINTTKIVKRPSMAKSLDAGNVGRNIGRQERQIPNPSLLVTKASDKNKKIIAPQKATTIRPKPFTMGTGSGDQASHIIPHVTANDSCRRAFWNGCGDSKNTSPKMVNLENERKIKTRKELNLHASGNSRTYDSGAVKMPTLPSSRVSGCAGRIVERPDRRAPILPWPSLIATTTVIRPKSSARKTMSGSSMSPHRIANVTAKGSCSRSLRNGCGDSELSKSTEKSIGSSKKRSPNVPLSVVKAAGKSKDVAPQGATAIRQEPSVKDAGRGDVWYRRAVRVTTRETWRLGNEPSDSSALSAKRLSRHRKKPSVDSAEIPSSEWRGLDAVHCGNSVDTWLADSMDATTGSVRGVLDDLESSSSAPGTGLAQVSHGSSKKPRADVGARQPTGRRRSFAVGNSTVTPRRPRVSGGGAAPGRCCSLASAAGGLCNVGKAVSAAARSALHSDRKNNRRLIEIAYAEPRTARGPSKRDESGWPLASAYVNRKAKQRETSRVNVALKNRLLRARPTVSMSVRRPGPSVAR